MVFLHRMYQLCKDLSRINSSKTTQKTTSKVHFQGSCYIFALDKFVNGPTLLEKKSYSDCNGIIVDVSENELFCLEL